MKSWKTRILFICAMFFCGMIIFGGRNKVYAAEIVASGYCGSNVAWTLDEEGTLVISGSGRMDYSASGPKSWHWDEYRMYILSVVIEEGVTSIGDYAFFGCSNLKSIKIPDTIRSIGKKDTFYKCESLTSVTIPEGVKSIGESTFDGCTCLRNVTIPESVTSIGYSAFYDCDSLTNVTIPESVTSIEGLAFAKCDSLERVVFLNKTTVIESNAFMLDSDEDCVLLAPPTIYGFAGSFIETYASSKNYPFVAIPVILTQPKDTAVAKDKTAKLTIKVLGKAPVYQWYYRTASTGSWQKVSGASGTKATYKFTATAKKNGYQYYCKVTDSEKTLSSNIVTLSVATEAPTIKTQPKDAIVLSTKKATFTVKASGGALSYQWYYRTSSTASWKKLTASSAKTANYSVTAESKKQGYQYRCVVKNPLGSVTSNATTLTVVTAKPSIKTQPKAQTVKLGTKVTFKVVASGRGLSYQWWYRTSSSSAWKKLTATSAKTASYSLTTAKKHNGYQYKCVVTNAKGSVTSKIVKLTVVTAKPTIKTQPKATVNGIPLYGADVTLKIVANGTALKYQWYYRTRTGTWKKIPDATEATYSFFADYSQSGYQYKCVVKNLMGSVTSKVVKPF